MAKKKAKKKGAKRKSAKRSSASRKSGKRGKRGGAKRRSSGSTAVVAVKRSKKTKRKLPAALKRPVQPDKKLASLIGSKKLQYSEIIKKLWSYFKRHGLSSGRTIRLDGKLKSSGIWGSKSKISMYEVGKALKHAK